MKYYLCQEHGEQFIIKASSLDEAQEEASMYGGEAIRELTKKELAASNPEKGEFAIMN